VIQGTFWLCHRLKPFNDKVFRGRSSIAADCRYVYKALPGEMRRPARGSPGEKGRPLRMGCSCPGWGPEGAHTQKPSPPPFSNDHQQRGQIACCLTRQKVRSLQEYVGENRQQTSCGGSRTQVGQPPHSVAAAAAAGRPRARLLPGFRGPHRTPQAPCSRRPLSVWVTCLKPLNSTLYNGRRPAGSREPTLQNAMLACTTDTISQPEKERVAETAQLLDKGDLEHCAPGCGGRWSCGRQEPPAVRCPSVSPGCRGEQKDSI
jgi:hypothetical protein